ncbi:hypothetical protein pb186bvf_003744 [Paramecium bursaria]
MDSQYIDIQSPSGSVAQYENMIERAYSNLNVLLYLRYIQIVILVIYIIDLIAILTFTLIYDNKVLLILSSSLYLAYHILMLMPSILYKINIIRHFLRQIHHNTGLRFDCQTTLSTVQTLSKKVPSWFSFINQITLILSYLLFSTSMWLTLQDQTNQQIQIILIYTLWIVDTIFSILPKISILICYLSISLLQFCFSNISSSNEKFITELQNQQKVNDQICDSCIICLDDLDEKNAIINTYFIDNAQLNGQKQTIYVLYVETKFIDTEYIININYKIGYIRQIYFNFLLNNLLKYIKVNYMIKYKQQLQFDIKGKLIFFINSPQKSIFIDNYDIIQIQVNITFEFENNQLIIKLYSFTQYLPVQNQYIEVDMVYDPQKLIEYGFGYGVWMRYGPLMKIGQVGSVLQNQSNNSLLTVIRDADTQAIQMVVQLTSDYENLIMQFEAFVYSTTQTHHIQHQINYVNFEGLWYIFYFQCKPVVQKCQFLFSDFYINQTFYEINEEYPFQSNNLKIVVGGGLKQDQYLLTYFPGIMRYETFNQQEGWYDNLDAGYFFSYATQFDNCFGFSQIFDDILFNSDTRIKMEQNQAILNGYTLRAWYKLTQILPVANNVNIIRVSQNGYQDFLNHIAGNTFGLSFSWDSSQTLAKLTTYSYLFPILNIDISNGDPFEINQVFIIENFNQWAYLQFSYNLRNFLMLFQIQYNQNKYQYTKNARQFSRSLATIYIGNNYYDQSDQQGIVKDFNFYICEGLDNLDEGSFCDQTCGTCFGPYNYQCSTCDPASNRVISSYTNSCICQLGFLENGGWSCYGQDDSKVLLFTQTYNCVWGQFAYNNKCYQCPNFNPDQDINCLECLSNPTQWIYDPYCYISYQQQDKNSNQVYIQIQDTQKQYYMLQDEQLLAVSNVAIICQPQNMDGCLYYPIQHLDKPTFIQCYFTSIMVDGLCVKCYDPYCAICIPINLDIPCQLCQNPYIFNTDTKLCEWNYDSCFGSTCPQYCDEFCTFCSHDTRNCKTCISGYYVGFDYKCHQCSIENCIRCFEYDIEDLNQNTLNFRHDYKESTFQIVVGCVQCEEGLIYDFFLQVCKVHKQIEPCLESYINLNSVEICTLEKGQEFSGISPQISDCTVLKTNCQICIKVLEKIQCVKCIDGYYADSVYGTCIVCDESNAISCTQISYQDQDAYMENYQGFYYTFRPDGQIYSSEVWFPIITPTKCKQGYIIRDSVCLKYCDSNCKTCIYFSEVVQYTCQECYPQNGFPIKSVVDGQCSRCPYLCDFCYSRTPEQIQLINSKFIQTDLNKYLTYACLKPYQNYAIDTKLQVIRYLNDLMDQGNLDIVENILFDCALTYFDFEKGYYRFDESQDLIDYLNIRQPNSYTHNITLSAYFCAFSIFMQDTILKKNVFALQKQTFQLIGFNADQQFQQQNFTLRGYDVVIMENFVFLFNDQQIFQLLNGDYEFYIKYLTFSNIGQSTIVTNLIVSNALLINFAHTIFNQYYVENSIFMELEQENSLIIKMTKISFVNCSFNNFTLFKTSSTLKLLRVFLDGVSFSNCNFTNFQLIQNTKFTSNMVELNRIVVYQCNFMNTNLFTQITNGNLQLNYLHVSYSNLTNSNLLSLNSDSILKSLIIEWCDLYNSKIISLNTFVSSSIQVDLTISGISLYNITYDSSRLIELDSYNFFKFNLILENIDFGYNILRNIDQNLFQGFWVIRCQNLQISSVQITRKYLNIIEFMLVNVSNIQISDVSVQSDGGNSSSNALFAIDQFQTIKLENIIISDQQVIDQPIIFITSESQIQLFSIQQEVITIKNITFTSNILKKTIQGKFESMIYIISNHYQQINIKDIYFKNNLIIEQIQNNQIDSCGLLFISSFYSTLVLQNIFSYNDTILNTSNTLFYIQTQTLELSNLESQRVNQQNLTQSNVGVLIIISNIINLKNIFINLVKSQIIGFMNIQTDQQGIINIDNLTIQGIQTLNTDPLAIDESIIQIDLKISLLQLNITNIMINSCILGSGGFLRINSQKIQNTIHLQNITLYNVYSFQCTLICMVLNSLIQYENNININNVTLINHNGYELELFIKNKINIYLSNRLNLLNLNNSLIEASYSNIAIDKLFIAGPLYVGYFLLTNMQNILLNQINLKNSELISSIPLYFTLNNENISQVVFNNIIIRNISINQQKNRRLLQQQSLYGQSFIQLSQIQNNHKIKIQNFIIQSINCDTCLNGFVIISLVQGQNVQFNINNLVFNKNQCGQTNCLTISNTQMNISNILDIGNSLLFENQANYGLVQITNISISFNNVTLIKNKAIINGSTIYYDSNQTSWKNVQIIENTGIQSGGLITQSTDSLNLNTSEINFQFNSAKQQPDNLLCQATNLIMLFQNIKLQFTSNQFNNTIINTPNIKNQNYIQFPNIDGKLSSYQIYDLSKEQYQNLNLQYDLFASNKYMEIFSQYQNTDCKLDIYDNEQNISYTQNISLSNQISGSTFDTIYFRSNPYSAKSFMTITIQCDFIQNYSYIIYAKSLPCQLGEYYFNQTCKTCDYIQGYYSVLYNATSCTKADTSLILNNTSNNLQLQQYQWRPTRLSPYIEYCHQNEMNCLGGWSTGDKSCLKGHIGALCEQCDIYNLRGDGQFSQNYGVICVSCGSSGIQILTIFGTLVWTMISAFVTVRSIIQSNLKLKQLKKINRKFFQILFRQDQDQSSTLLKMAIYDMQIIQAIYTFQIKFSFNMSSFNDFISYPIESVTYNIECNLSQTSDIPIIYLRIIWILLVSMFTIILFIMIYLFALIAKKQKYESVVIYTLLIYMFVYIQPYIMRQVSSLVASRTISNLKWVQGNVSYRYDTFDHYKWIAGLAIPVIITFGVTIPLLFFILLYRFRQTLYFDVVRNKIGYLYNEYRQHSFYWENVKILHMQLIIFILTIYQDEIQLKACIIYLIVFLYFVLQQDQKPYNQSMLNKFDNQMIFVIGVSLILSQAIYSSQQANLFAFKQVLEIVLNLLLVYIYINFLTRLIFAVFQRLESQIDTLKDFIKSKGALLGRFAPGLMRYLSNRAKQKARVQKRFQLIRNYLINRVKGMKNYETVLKSQQMEIQQQPLPDVNQINQAYHQEQVYNLRYIILVNEFRKKHQ